MPFVIKNTQTGNYLAIAKSAYSNDKEVPHINKTRIYRRKRDASESLNLSDFSSDVYTIVETEMVEKDVFEEIRQGCLRIINQYSWKSMDTAPRFDDEEKNVPILIKYERLTNHQYNPVVSVDTAYWDPCSGYFFGAYCGKMYGTLLGWMHIPK